MMNPRDRVMKLAKTPRREQEDYKTKTHEKRPASKPPTRKEVSEK